ncbi:hypothetical protein C8F04DRAFT_1197541 [Mycena alexandri]|uniref:Uncharacterized protein n=1 Tax=Mycena alexandri TaxID=1745969 RepID=A0AAD6S305_9AGAR|nr:hypothetical protein C8F04DRAFT_1197541 [Mycena alexandri]
MVNNCHIVNVLQCTVKPLRSRHYSTTQQTPRFASTPTQIEPPNPNPGIKSKRRPLVEAHFSDGARQPFIHDFRVQLKHGRKISHFCIFLKRGMVLSPNACTDVVAGDVVVMRVGTKDPKNLVNMRATDRVMADFVLAQCLPEIILFQGGQRIRLPKELTVVRTHAFPR